MCLHPYSLKYKYTHGISSCKQEIFIEGPTRIQQGSALYKTLTYYLYVQTERQSKMTAQVLDIFEAAEVVN